MPHNVTRDGPRPRMRENDDIGGGGSRLCVATIVFGKCAQMGERCIDDRIVAGVRLEYPGGREMAVAEWHSDLFEVRRMTNPPKLRAGPMIGADIGRVEPGAERVIEACEAKPAAPQRRFNRLDIENGNPHT